MWKTTTRTQLKQPKKVAENKATQSPPWRGGVDYILPGGPGGWIDGRPDISEITYFTVLRVLSEALGKLPVHVRDKDHRIVEGNTERLLTVRPNDSMTPSQLFSYAEYCRNHYGNAYIYCNWSGSTGQLKSIEALDPRCIRIWVDDVSTDIIQRYYYSYTTMTGNSYIIPVSYTHLTLPTIYSV